MDKDEYREKVIENMKMMGAVETDLALLKEETIINGIRDGRKPEDVAWAVMQ